MPVDLPALDDLRTAIRHCLERADAAGLTDVALRLDAAYVEINRAGVLATGDAVPPPLPPAA